jgi:hypothetical protein
MLALAVIVLRFLVSLVVVLLNFLIPKKKPEFVLTIQIHGIEVFGLPI